MFLRIVLPLVLVFAALPAAEPARPSGLGAADSDLFQAGPPEAAARYASKNWALVWADEFSDGTMPSQLKWNYEHGLLRNHELQFYTAARRENSRIEDGQLIITGRHEPWEGAAYTSASLTTKGKFAFTYGKVEVRAKIPTGRGTWPAIWLLGNEDKVDWPLCGEIDIMENVGFDPQKIHFTTHTGAFNHVKKTQRSRAIMVEKPWADFHRYGLIWTPERLEYFFDGEKVSEFVNDGRGPSHWPFDAPQYLILNLALGGAWGGQRGVDDAIFPVEFRIDYVRVWQAPGK
jgi:beta-glucanase (GH16 family)